MSLLRATSRNKPVLFVEGPWRQSQAYINLTIPVETDVDHALSSTLRLKWQKAPKGAGIEQTPRLESLSFPAHENDGADLGRLDSPHESRLPVWAMGNPRETTSGVDKRFC